MVQQVFLPLAIQVSLAACASQPAQHAACPLELVTELNVDMRSGLPVVEMLIDGKSARMVIDTGADTVAISEAARDRLGLPIDTSVRNRRGGGIGGESDVRVAIAGSMRLGRVIFPESRIDVIDLPTIEKQIGAMGLIGYNALGRFDIDFDLAHGRVTLYRGRTCANGVPPWTTAGPTPWQRLAPLPLQPGLPRTGIEVLVDGQPQIAVLDSGAQRSLLNRSRAAELGVTDAMLNLDVKSTSAGAGPNIVVTSMHRFRTITIGEDRLEPPVLEIGRLSSRGPGYRRDILLGQDFLSQRRVWLSFQSRSIFIQR